MKGMSEEYKEKREEIFSLLDDGRFWKPNLHEIAEETGVSSKTVSKYYRRWLEKTRSLDIIIQREER